MSGASPAEVSGLPCRAGGTGQTLGTDGLWRLGRGEPLAYAKGMHSLIRAAMVSCTRPALPRFRFRLALFEDAKWRRPGLRRSNLPEAVNLNRLATAFFVFRRAMDLGMGPRRVMVSSGSATLFCISGGKLHRCPCGRPGWNADKMLWLWPFKRSCARTSRKSGRRQAEHPRSLCETFYRRFVS